MKKWPPCKISWRDPIVANSYASTRKDPSKQYPMSSTTFSCFSLDTKDTCIRQPQKKRNWISLEIWLQKFWCICMSPCRYILDHGRLAFELYPMKAHNIISIISTLQIAVMWQYTRVWCNLSIDVRCGGTTKKKSNLYQGGKPCLWKEFSLWLSAGI